MKSLPLEFHHFEFNFPVLNAHLLVEVRDEEVTIRASRDCFSEDRKAYFIRELAAEGFIPDAFLWYSPYGERKAGRSIVWKVDSSWLGRENTIAIRSRQLYFHALSYSALVMALFMGLLFSGKLGNVRVGSAPPEQHVQTVP